MGTLILVALIFAAIGVLFTSLGIGMGRAERRFTGGAQLAAATVTDLRSRSAGHQSSGLIWIPVVRFNTPDGRLVEAETNGGTNMKRHKPGQAIEVIYDPANPTDVRVPNSGTGFIHAGFVVLGGIFTLVGLLMVAIAVAVA